MRSDYTAGLRDLWKYIIPLLVLHGVGAVMLGGAAGHYPALWGMGVIAYTLGLRHAFDADHIAAIDNTVRKLTQQNRNPLGVGFFFACGHSSVVLLMVIATTISMRWAQRKLPLLQDIGGVAGATVSGVFLIVVGIVNLFILMNLFEVRRKYRAGELAAAELEKSLHVRGLLAWLTKPLIKLIGRSWHVYPLGFLFGLGFDTASEIALLAMSGTAANQALPIAGILALPLLFAAGMTLMDTANGVMAVKAYRWALREPLRKLRYNLVVTFIAIVAALSIGAIELLETFLPGRSAGGAMERWIGRIDLSWWGYILVGLIAVAWLASFMGHRRREGLLLGRFYRR
ncbi:HoxN/HupN/NixA family nickel/cobalt transporter [Cohnella fermenti]|uniref:Nickel/cobalt efflux system n=1 Tax=Cohnella fermenti TaxID=2565925 RepID=A0A4S4BR96_9BACL|nr:HoxN/HupN/NixA family nickel/cobalt transporter [Cohnella fermenti]THF76687.1 HoxN/HupN/NixA family nickel/cobalt transporter [Cohnella fermenti]